jgi:hypothetical protein
MVGKGEAGRGEAGEARWGLVWRAVARRGEAVKVW